jgi:hypothetical protein
VEERKAALVPFLPKGESMAIQSILLAVIFTFAQPQSAKAQSPCSGGLGVCSDPQGPSSSQREPITQEGQPCAGGLAICSDGRNPNLPHRGAGPEPQPIRVCSAAELKQFLPARLRFSSVGGGQAVLLYPSPRVPCASSKIVSLERIIKAEQLNDGTYEITAYNAYSTEADFQKFLVDGEELARSPLSIQARVNASIANGGAYVSLSESNNSVVVHTDLP